MGLRRVLDAVAALALAFLWGVTLVALYGPERLPERIPMHFDRTGTPNGWGSPNGMFLLPVLAVVILAVIGWVRRSPGSFNYPARVTAANRARLQDLAMRMMALIQAETALLFAVMQEAMLRALRSGHFGLPGLVIPLWVMLLLFTTFGHIWAMQRAS